MNDGRCCDECNVTIVVPARLRLDWKKTINIKPALADPDLRSGARKVVQLLEPHEEFEGVIDELRAVVDNAEGREWTTSDTDYFNAVLDEIYDRADSRCVWLGL